MEHTYDVTRREGMDAWLDALVPFGIGPEEAQRPLGAEAAARLCDSTDFTQTVDPGFDPQGEQVGHARVLWSLDELARELCEPWRRQTTPTWVTGACCKQPNPPFRHRIDDPVLFPF